jgi:hypothetical protein
MNRLEELRHNSELIKKVNSNVYFLKKQFEIILSQDSSKFNDPNIDETLTIILNCFMNIIDLVPLMITMVDTPHLVRGRANYNGELFSNQQQISYNSQFPELIQYGRFNNKREAVFYASLPTESNSDDYVRSCVLECCKELTAEQKRFKFQDVTVGGWILKEPIPAVNLCMDTNHLQGNRPLGEAVVEYQTLIDDCLSNEASSFILEFMNYFSSLSGTKAFKDYDYYVTIVMFHAIREYYGSIFNEPKFGLIYPGAMSDKRGLNLVLTAEGVDRFLELERVLMFRYYRDYKGTDGLLPDQCSEVVFPNNESFEFKHYRRPGER